MKNQKSFFSLGSSLMACFLIGALLAASFGVPQLTLAFGGGLVLVGMIPKGSLGSAFMATPDTSALAAYAGKYEAALFSVLRNGIDILKDLTMLPGVKNTIKLTKLTVKDGVRGYRETFDAADDDLAYSGRDLTVELLKRDMLINPLKYRSTWMSEYMTKGVDPKEIPFAKHVNEAVAAKIASEVNDNCYLAVKGAATSVATTFNGLGTVIATEIIGGGLVPIATGAITNVNAVSKLELMTKAMPVAYRKAGFSHFVSYDVFDKYNEDYRERFGKYLAANDNGVFYIDGTSRKVALEPVTWMGTSQRIISSPKINLLVGLDGTGDMDKIHTDQELEILKQRWLFAFGFQIRDLEAVRVNDLA